MEHQGSCRVVKRFVYSSEDQGGGRVHGRKSYSNPAGEHNAYNKVLSFKYTHLSLTDVSKLTGESGGTRQTPATGILVGERLD